MKWALGNIQSPETKEKNRQAHLGKRASVETRAKLSASHTGLVASEASKAKRSATLSGRAQPWVRERMLEHAANPPEGCKCFVCRPTFESTSLERRLWALLADFPTVETQRRFGRYRVDAYLPEYRLAFEADGHRWHRDKAGAPERDAARDAWILENHGVIVVRLDQDSLGI